jgi:hypothetical protein
MPGGDRGSSEVPLLLECALRTRSAYAMHGANARSYPFWVTPAPVTRIWGRVGKSCNLGLTNNFLIFFSPSVNVSEINPHTKLNSHTYRIVILLKLSYLSVIALGFIIVTTTSAFHLVQQL